MILVTNIVVVLGCLHLIFPFQTLWTEDFVLIILIIFVMYVDNSPQDQRKNISRRLKTAYKHYFGCQLRDQDKTWAPHVCCTVCYSGVKWQMEEDAFRCPHGVTWANKPPFRLLLVWRTLLDSQRRISRRLCILTARLLSSPFLIMIWRILFKFLLPCLKQRTTEFRQSMCYSWCR